MGRPSGSQFVFNDYIIGHVQIQEDTAQDTTVHILDKKLLLNLNVSATDTWVREISLPYDCTSIDINISSFVCAKDGNTWIAPNANGVGAGWDWTWDNPKKGKLFIMRFWMKPVENEDPQTFKCTQM